MKDKFLIGELSKIFNISTDTLRHYDKIDLIKPEYDENNDYRYYSIRDFFKLSRILFLKNLDISLGEIKKYMGNKNTNNLLCLLKKKEEEIDIKNHADQIIYQTEKLLKETGDKVSEGDKKPVQEELEALKNIAKGSDVTAIKNQTEALEKKLYELSSKLYQQAPPQGGQGDPSGNSSDGAGGAGGNYYDADYKVVDDDDKKK